MGLLGMGLLGMGLLGMGLLGMGPLGMGPLGRTARPLRLSVHSDIPLRPASSFG
jgi:hypothetical protein